MKRGYYRFVGNKITGRNNQVVVSSRFSYEKMYDRFAGNKNTGRSNKVASRRGSNIVVHNLGKNVG